MNSNHLSVVKDSADNRSMRQRLLAAGVGAVLSFAAFTATAGPAQAAETRPGARFGQIDMLLSAYETEAARRSYWAASVICWHSGLGGKLTILGVCPGMVSVCAARAYYATPRARAGITYTPWGSAWCWKY